jgi:hypothetical protein
MIVGWSGIGRAVLLTAALALGGCDTVGGWLGFDEDNTTFFIMCFLASRCFGTARIFF